MNEDRTGTYHLSIITYHFHHHSGGLCPHDERKGSALPSTIPLKKIAPGFGPGSMFEQNQGGALAPTKVAPLQGAFVVPDRTRGSGSAYTLGFNVCRLWRRQSEHRGFLFIIYHLSLFISPLNRTGVKSLTPPHKQCYLSNDNLVGGLLYRFGIVPLPFLTPRAYFITLPPIPFYYNFG